jgi:four helix bundle protein
MDLAQAVYALTNHFPRSEEFGLSSQMRRASVSVPSNIAEGYGRNATGEYWHFLCIARGSLLELETQILLSQRVSLLRPEEVRPITDSIGELAKMLSALIARIH